MKKRTIIAMMLVSSMLLSACGNAGDASNSASSTESSTESSTQDSEAAESESEKKEAAGDGETSIGVSTCLMTEFFVDQLAAIDKYAEENGMEIVGEFDANMDSQKQLDHIRTFASQGVDVIITSPVDTTIASEMLDIAGDIPIVFTNRPPEEAVLDGVQATYVGSEETDAGKMQAEYLTDYFNEKGVKEINYALFIGDLGAENAKQRTESVKKELENAGFQLNATFEDTANWDRTEALNKMQQVLGSGKAVDCVISNSDEMALGAIEALKDAGKLEETPVVSIDGAQNALLAIQNGEMSMTVLQNADNQAKAAVEAAQKFAAGETLESYYWVPYEKITAENVEDYLK